MAIATAEADFFDRVDLLGLDVGRRLNPQRRTAMGQFFTPAAIARFMSLLLVSDREEICLIDPGAGVGTLSAAWIAQVCSLERPPKKIHLVAFEADAELAMHLRETMASCGTQCGQRNIEFQAEVLESDFIDAASEMLADRSLFGQAFRKFDCAILNPPYRKLSSASSARRALRSVGIETSNLYTAFLWLTFRLLKPDGEMVAITPRSFCNGPYFRPFREAFLREMGFTRMHLFESRKAAFQTDDVLQENIIFRAVKGKRPNVAIVSASAGPADADIYSRDVPYSELVSPTDPESVIHIVPDNTGVRFAQRVQELPAQLVDLDLQISTGRVVDFRARQWLAAEPDGRTVPLLYPAHFDNGHITWPKPGKKPNYLQVSAETEALLVPPGNYVLVKRFSAKEEKRRVVAALCSPKRLPDGDFGIENHLNYFHRHGQGISEELAKGLAAYLNSTLVDSYFRQFSGHTQVNAADLRNLRYPDTAALERIGNRIGEAYPQQEDLDTLIREEFGMGDDDPARVRQRLEESREVLVALGLRKLQQNERSALTLLALLDLKPETPWRKASAPLRGITPIMDWFAEHYGKRYAPQYSRNGPQANGASVH